MADSRYKNNNAGDIVNGPDGAVRKQKVAVALQYNNCLLYTSDAADEL
mgnify:CR=1 FL=1